MLRPILLLSVVIFVGCASKTRTVGQAVDGGNAGAGASGGTAGAAGSSTGGSGGASGSGGSSGASGAGGVSGSDGGTAGSSGAGGTAGGGGAGAQGGSAGAAGTGGADAGSDAAALSCDSDFSFGTTDFQAAIPFEVFFTAQVGYAYIDLEVAGPGTPQATLDSTVPGPPFTWSFTVTGHAAGKHVLTFVKDKNPPASGVAVASCEILVL